LRQRVELRRARAQIGTHLRASCGTAVRRGVTAVQLAGGGLADWRSLAVDSGACTPRGQCEGRHLRGLGGSRRCELRGSHRSYGQWVRVGEAGPSVLAVSTGGCAWRDAAQRVCGRLARDVHPPPARKQRSTSTSTRRRGAAMFVASAEELWSCAPSATMFVASVGRGRGPAGHGGSSRDDA
jgi:hypothetical protein